MLQLFPFFFKNLNAIELMNELKFEYEQNLVGLTN